MQHSDAVMGLHIAYHQSIKIKLEQSYQKLLSAGRYGRLNLFAHETYCLQKLGSCHDSWVQSDGSYWSFNDQLYHIYKVLEILLVA